MNFNEALECLKQGRKVRRPSWVDTKYITLTTATTFNGKEFNEFDINVKHILANDWEVVE